MTRRAPSTAALALCAVAACDRPRNSHVSPPPQVRAPQRTELEVLLRAHAGHRFDPAAQRRGCPAEQSLGEYVATLVRNTRAADGAGESVHRLSLGCEPTPSWLPMPLDPPADPVFWPCRMDAYTSDRAGESPWHYELRFRVRRSDRALDLTTLACPGAS
jgi:hypothetical protein